MHAPGRPLVTAALVAAALVAVALPAGAAPAGRQPQPGDLRVDVFHGVRDASAAHGGFSHTIYMNDCRPGGCLIRPGDDDSRTDTSSIPFQLVQLDAWPWGDAEWAELVQCVRETYAPFDIDVVTDDPGNADHFEVFVGGDPEALHPELAGALGVAPFIACGGIIDNAPSFVFANVTSGTDVLCWAVAQETSHVFGLDHELLAEDPMTYLSPPYRKRFQNQAADCGESLGSPRGCYCGGNQQNSYAFLAQTFGTVQQPPPAVRFITPFDGAWVTPAFPIRVEADTLIGVADARVAVDGTPLVQVTGPPVVGNAPAGLAPGAHTLSATVTDQGGQVGSATVTVELLTACGSGCPAATACLGGWCVPDASQPGGLGSACTAGEQCGSGQCTASTDGPTVCTAPCDPGRSCPGGFHCVGGEGDAGGVCWPGEASGGCSTGSGAGPGAGLAVLLVVLGRVRRNGRTRRRGHRPA